MLRVILMFFEAMTGIKVNLSKNEIVPVGLMFDVESIELMLGCKVSLLPMNYLGLPLEAH